MKKVIALFPLLIFSIAAISQKLTNKLKFEQGQTLEVSMQITTTIAQQVMGQAIDFDVEGSAIQLYKVTNATDDNSTLHHQVQQIAFTFDGMGQKRSFDSKNQKDMEDIFGKPMKELLGKSFDMIIDPTGQALMVKPEKIEPTKMEGPMILIGSMLKDLLDIIQPPKKGSSSFFKLLPQNEIIKGNNWTESVENASGKSNTAYTVAEITDSTIAIDFTGNSVTTAKGEMMGNETTTTMNNKTTGKIIVDKASCIIRQKTSATESNGSTVVMGNSVPVTSKTVIVIIVKPE